MARPLSLLMKGFPPVDKAIMIHVKLDRLLAERKMRLTDLAARVGIALPNLSLLKNGKVKEIRLGLLDGLCRELGCQPGDLLVFGPAGAPAQIPAAAPANAGIDFID